MEEIQCCLVGFGSDLFSPDELLRDMEINSNNNNSNVDTAPLHPTERELLRAVLPLGRAYAYLHEITHRTAIGQRGSSSSSSANKQAATTSSGGTGLYYAALAMAVQQHVLRPYREAVEAAATPTALCAVGDHFWLTLQLLLRLFRAPAGLLPLLHPSPLVPSSATTAAPEAEGSDSGTSWAVPITAIEDFLSHREVPLAVRAAVGEQVWLALLHTIAHYVAHGVVLHGREDFFISVTSPGASGGGEVGEEEVHTLHADRLPRCLSVDFGAFLVSTGRERRALLSDSIAPGGSYLEALAMGAQDEAADTVYHAVFNPSLCAGGILQAEELWARVEAAKALWSKALWARVGSARQLHDRLHALRDMFLCHRGDLWGSFMQQLFTTYVSRERRAAAAGGHAYTSEAEMGEAPRLVSSLTRAVVEAYESACSVTGVADLDRYSGFRVVVGAATPATNEEEEEEKKSGRHRSVEDAALYLVRRVGDIGIHYAVPTGLHHIVSRKALVYYQHLFSFYLQTHLADVALQDARTALAEAMMGNPQPSHPLRRAFALYHHSHFLLHNLREYLHVDVKAAAARALHQQLERCGGVEEAKRLHDKYLWDITEGSFLVEGAEAPLEACRALCRHAVTLQVLCRRYRVAHWAVEGANETPIEVTAVLQALEGRLQQEVVLPLTCTLQDHGGGGAAARRTAGLWTRLDFNRFYSSSFMRPSQEMTSGPAFAFMVAGTTAARGGGGGAPARQVVGSAPAHAAARTPRSRQAAGSSSSSGGAAAVRRRSSAAGAAARATTLSATTITAITSAAAAATAADTSASGSTRLDAATGRGRQPPPPPQTQGLVHARTTAGGTASVASSSSTPPPPSETGETQQPQPHTIVLTTAGGGGGMGGARSGAATAVEAPTTVVRRRAGSATASRTHRTAQQQQQQQQQQQLSQERSSASRGPSEK